MGVRMLLFLSVLCLFWCSDAREVVTTNRASRTNFQLSGREVQTSEIGRNNQICTLCVEFTAEALNYPAQNKTQTEIIEILHKSCSKLQSFRQQCIALVDYYAPLFFLEIASMQPGDFCHKVNLCDQVASKFQNLPRDSCDLCHLVVTEALIKLKDPTTQLEMIETLLKACDAAESYAKKCKKLVLKYGPVLLVNAEQFLETNDICTTLHACDATSSSATSMHSAS